MLAASVPRRVVTRAFHHQVRSCASAAPTTRLLALADFEDAWGAAVAAAPNAAHTSHRVAVIDVRRRGEFAASHVPGSVFLEHGFYLEGWAGSVLRHHDRPYLLVGDASDARTANARTALEKQGFKNCAGVLEGGFGAWQREGRDTMSIPMLQAAELAKRQHRDERLALDEQELGNLQQQRPSDDAGSAATPTWTRRRVLLDVRSREEWDEGRARGAFFAPIRTGTAMSASPWHPRCIDEEAAEYARIMLDALTAGTVRTRPDITTKGAADETVNAAVGGSLKGFAAARLASKRSAIGSSGEDAGNDSPGVPVSKSANDNNDDQGDAAALAGPPRSVVVYCAGGYRSLSMCCLLRNAAAASLASASSADKAHLGNITLVNLADGFGAFREAAPPEQLYIPKCSPVS
jgi:rhodanese-related sulfurtransferase